MRGDPVRALEERPARLADHEQRLGALERARWPIASVGALAAVELTAL